MTSQDICWAPRLANYSMALAQLTKAVDLAVQWPLSELEQHGLVHAFLLQMQQLKSS